VIARLIELSARNQMVILLITAVMVAAGIWAVTATPLDAIPDLSDPQVIVYTEYAGQAP
jgi:Cu(I)/Ag(I) efflux system membrane protein CusA/SilA